MLFSKILCVAGCRNYDDWEKFESEMLKYVKEIGLNPEKDKIVVGSLKGADAMGAVFARKYGYDWNVVYAEWEKYGKSAGPRRNETMLKLTDFLIAFYDGESKGTGHAIKTAKKYEIPTRIVEIPKGYSVALEALKENNVR